MTAPTIPAPGMKKVPTLSTDSVPAAHPSSFHLCHPSPPFVAAWWS